VNLLFADTFYFLELEHNDGTWRWRQVATSFRTYAYRDLLRPVGLDRGYRDTSIAVTAEYRRNLRGNFPAFLGFERLLQL